MQNKLIQKCSRWVINYLHLQNGSTERHLQTHATLEREEKDAGSPDDQ